MAFGTPTNIGASASGSAASLAITVGAGGVPANSLLCVGASASGISNNSLTGTAVTDTQTNAYSKVDSVIINNTSSNGSIYLFFSYNITALVSGNTITFTPAASGRLTLSCFYVTGEQISSSPIDAAASTSGGAFGQSTTPSATMRAAPVAANSLVVGVIGSGFGSGDTFTQDSTNAAYATPPNSASVTGSAIYGGNVVSSSQLTYAPSLSTSRQWGEVIGVFAPAPPSCSPTLTTLGVGCGIWMARKIRENPTLFRRQLFVPHLILRRRPERLRCRLSD